MQNFYQCESIESIENWLKDNANQADWLASEFNRLKNYQNAVEWNQLVLVCEALTLHRWGDLEPVEAYCGKSISGSWDTALFNAQWQVRHSSRRDWSKKDDSFVIYKGEDNTNYHVEKLNSQRNNLPTNPFKVGQFIANCQLTVAPFAEEIKKLHARLEAQMQPQAYGNDFYYANIYCCFSNHDDEYITVRSEYLHDEASAATNKQKGRYYIEPHIKFGKLSIRRGRLCWTIDIYFTRAWGEMPLTKQKQAFKEDLAIIFAEFESKIAKKKLRYNAKQATMDAMQIINKWVAA